MKRRELFLLILCCMFFTRYGMPQEKTNVFKRGAGSIEYTAYDPLSKKPITLYYYIPTKGNIKEMSVLFSMHGAERKGDTQRNAWRNLAEEYGFIVLAPQFTQANGYPINDYQYGGVSESLDDFMLKPQETWTFQVIEKLFDYFKDSTGSISETYHMFGHSGGGQFVHRYLMLMPEARVGRAIVGNPGSYVFPKTSGDFVDSTGWPYSLKGTPFATDEYLAPFFKRDIIVMAGTLDTASVPSHLAAHYPVVQGPHRYARAWNFFNTAQSIALENDYEFNWQIVDVPEVGHSNSGMLYGNPRVRSSLNVDGQRVYNNEDLTDIGAFSLLKTFLCKITH